MQKQTIFESTQALENAQIMLDMCREEYARAGHGESVQALRGLDVTSLDTAHVALLTVRGLPNFKDVAEVRQYAITALAQALNSLRGIRLAS